MPLADSEVPVKLALAFLSEDVIVSGHDDVPCKPALKFFGTFPPVVPASYASSLASAFKKLVCMPGNPLNFPDYPIPASGTSLPRVGI